jgi:hypothetical protein
MKLLRWWGVVVTGQALNDRKKKKYYEVKNKGGWDSYRGVFL